MRDLKGNSDFFLFGVDCGETRTDFILAMFCEIYIYIYILFVGH